MLALVVAHNFMVDLINLKSKTNCYAFNCGLRLCCSIGAPTQVHYGYEARYGVVRKPQSCRSAVKSPSSCDKI